MKKTFLVLFSTAFLFTVFAAGCQKMAPDVPAPPMPAPTVYITAFGENIDNFEDADLNNDFNYTWTARNDSADGGSSTVDSFGISLGSSSAYGLAITTTVSCDINPSNSDYTSLDITAYSGYALIECAVPPLDINDNNMSVMFNHAISDSAGMTVKLFIYSGSQYLVSSAIVPPLTWSGLTVDYSAMTTGGAYAADDVLSNVDRFIIALRYTDVPGYSKQVEYYIDDFRLKSIP